MTINRLLGRLGIAAGIALSTTGFAAMAQAQEVNLYTTREPGLIKPLLDAFTKSSGVKVNAVFVKEGIAERVAAEGKLSPADVLMSVDMGSLVDLVEKGLTQPVKSQVLDTAVPANLRDPAGHWFTLSMRARVAYVSKDRVKQTSFTYEELSDPKWKGKVCIRAGQHPYNTALIANYMAKHGEAKTEEWLKGIKANAARKPGGGDRDVARDIMGGICDVGIANSYYVGLMRSGSGGPEQEKWGAAINVLLPTFSDGAGSHVNISGAGVAKTAPNRDNAVKLLEYLVSDEAQKLYAQSNYEYPVKASAEVDPIIAKLGVLKVDSTQITEIAKNRRAASTLVDKVGLDN